MKTPPFKIGDKVKLKHHGTEPAIVRQITRIVRRDWMEGSYLIIVDGGEPCPLCGLKKGKTVSSIGTDWLTKVEDEK